MANKPKGPKKKNAKLTKGFKLPKGVKLKIMVEDDGKMHIMGCRGIPGPDKIHPMGCRPVPH
jgi:hypothetical protein